LESLSLFYIMKAYRGREVKLSCIHYFLALDGDSHLHTPAALPLIKQPYKEIWWAI